MDAMLEERVYAQLRTPRTLVGLDEQYRALKDLIDAAMRDKQSTSVLCVGRPGTGKNACVNSVVSSLAPKSGIRVIRLTGYLHAQAHIGLREALAQLGEGADDEAKTKNSLPDEVIAELLGRLRLSALQGRPIVLLLSSFERFAAQPRQTLLYSLLELTHAASAVVLIGITSAFDALDQLEKRVRSRFSHRHVLFLGPQSVDDIKRIAQAALVVEASLPGAEQWNHACQSLLASSDASAVLAQHLQHTNDVRHFLNLLHAAAARRSSYGSIVNKHNQSLAVTHTTGSPSVESLQQASRAMLADVKAHFLRSLSLAEMVLVIVFSKLRKLGLTRINFELIWQHVSRPQDALVSFWELQDKALMLRVMERLVELGVFRFAPHSARSLPPGYRLLQLQASDSQVHDALVADAANADVSTLLRAWSR